jgi:thioredoxin reductase
MRCHLRPILLLQSFLIARSIIHRINDQVEVDQWGYVSVDEEMQINIPDVYAVGDVRSKRIRQITGAVNDGTIAAVHIAAKLGG